jgi:hypothetical protein
MLIYNVNGTVSDIQINAIIDGKITSSLATASNIADSLITSASNAVIVNATNVGSSSAVAYGLGYKTNASPTNTGTIYLSGATIDRLIGYYTQSGIIVSSSNQAIQAKYPTSTDLHTRGQINYHITSSASFLIVSTSFFKSANDLKAVISLVFALPLFKKTLYSSTVFLKSSISVTVLLIH